MRPDAVADRVVYALFANLLIAVGGAVFVLRWLALRSCASAERSGFRTFRRAVVASSVGFALGLLLYLLPGPPPRDPVVLLNGFAQVLPVSVAEVLVCWAVVGTVAETTLRHLTRRTAATAAGILVASVLFGLYHFAHSPPFNSLLMVLLLASVGLATGIFFYASRDVWGTIVFHNFLALAGVLQALEAAGEGHALARLQPHLLVMAGLSVGLLVLAHRFLLRPSTLRAARSGTGS